MSGSQTTGTCGPDGPEDAEYRELLKEERERKQRIANAKACAWIAAVPVALILLIGSLPATDPRGGAYAFAAVILSLGNALVTAQLRGW